jgi:hypothetical protein
MFTFNRVGKGIPWQVVSLACGLIVAAALAMTLSASEYGTAASASSPGPLRSGGAPVFQPVQVTYYLTDSQAATDAVRWVENFATMESMQAGISPGDRVVDIIEHATDETARNFRIAISSAEREVGGAFLYSVVDLRGSR